MSGRALFLDRDGTLIHDVGYPKDPARVELLPDVGPALADAVGRGFRLVVVSNQSGVARGLLDEEDVRLVQARVDDLFAEIGVRFDRVYFCLHGPDDGCACRKPAPGMILRGARELDLDLSASVMIGDKTSDVEAGRAAGCRTIAFGAPTPLADERLGSWIEIRRWLAFRD